MGEGPLERRVDSLSGAGVGSLRGGRGGVFRGLAAAAISVSVGVGVA